MIACLSSLINVECVYSPTRRRCFCMSGAVTLLRFGVPGTGIFYKVVQHIEELFNYWVRSQ